MLQRSVTRLEQAERLQRALYAIADQANSDREMPDVLRAMHEIVGSLMYAENFYIVLYDRSTESMRFAYFVDVADTDVPSNDSDAARGDARQPDLASAAPRPRADGNARRTREAHRRDRRRVRPRMRRLARRAAGARQ